MRVRLQVLLVTADSHVVDDVRDHLGAGPVGADLLHVEDSDAALRFLRREGEHDEAVLPDLVLVDIEGATPLLAEISGDPELEALTVVALADDPAAADELVEPYRLHDVVGKPPGPDGLLPVLAYINEL